MTFILGLGISLSFGFLARHRIHSQSVDRILQDYIPKSEKFSLELEGVKLQFRNGWLPAFAITAEGVRASDQKCKDRNILASGVFLPLRLLHLLRGEVLAEKIYIRSLVTTFPKDCLETRTGSSKEFSSGSPKAKVTETGSSKKPSILVPQKAFHFYREVLASLPLETLAIDDLQFFVVDGDQTKVQVHGTLKFKKNKGNVSFVVSPKKLWVKQTALPVRKGKISVVLSEKKLDVEVRSRLREGKVEASVQFSNNREVTTLLDVHLTKIPVSLVTDLFFKDIGLRYLWLNCGFSVEGPFRKFYGTPFPLEDCGLKGPYGSVVVSSPAMTLEAPESVHVQFQKLQLDEILKQKREVYLSGILSSFGVFSGEMNFLNESQWKLDGALSEAKVLFSRNSLRELQKIKTLPVELEFKSDGYFGKVRAADIDQGKFKGVVELTLNKERTEGELKIAIDGMALSEKVYKLMLRGKKEVFSIFGKAQLVGARFASWSGVATSPRLITDDFRLEGLTIESLKRAGDEPSLVVSAERGALLYPSTLRAWIQPTTMGSPWPKEPLDFSQFSVGFSKVAKGGESPLKNWSWQWKKGRLNFSNGWSLSGDGAVRPDERVEGWVLWDIPNQSPLKWQYSGVWGKASWSPLAPWMKIWLKEHPDFLSENPLIDYKVPPDENVHFNPRGTWGFGVEDRGRG